MFLEIIVQLIPIFSSVDLLDVIQSVSIPPSQDANDVVDPARDFRFEPNWQEKHTTMIQKTQWHKKCCKHHLQWPSTNLRRFSTQNRAGSFVVSLFIPIGIVYRLNTLALFVVLTIGIVFTQWYCRLIFPPSTQPNSPSPATNPPEARPSKAFQNGTRVYYGGHSPSSSWKTLNTYFNFSFNHTYSCTCL